MWKGAAGFVTAFEATLDALEPPTPCRRSSLDGFLASAGAAWRWLCSLQRRWHISYMALWSMQKGIPASLQLQPEVEYNIMVPPPKTYQFHKSTGIYSKICYFWYVILDSGIWGMLYSVYSGFKICPKESPEILNLES